jgi:aldose sugar dehydrogenase
MNIPRRTRPSWGRFCLSLGLAAAATAATAQTPPPTPSLVDPDLTVRTAVTGLSQPINLAFIGRNDMFVLEKGTGRVQRVVDGAVHSTVLDLAVNSASERGLLGIALHPDFRKNGWVYLFWSESSTGADSTDLASVPLLGNRVDRYKWNGTTLTHDRNLIRLRAFQADAGQPLRGNHNGGVIVFGPEDGRDGDRDDDDDDDDGHHRSRAMDGDRDGRGDNGHGHGHGRNRKAKLYIQVGDTGRRGQTQNLEDGPFGPGMPDDQFGGPEPDNAHLTGVILRLNDDGTTPRDNPFHAHGAAVGGEVGANIQKIYSYGLRNGFGMDFDPVSGDLWEQENGDDSFSELNRAFPGFNSGWVQIMGPVERIAQFKEIETSPQFFGLQQIRWPPTNIADTPAEALDRLFVLPGSRYSRPEMAWKFEVAPGAIQFVEGKGLGSRYEHDLIMGGARPTLEGGHLFRFELTGNRRAIRVRDPRLEDRVADNLAKFEITESESLLFGRNFGTVVDLRNGPNGSLYAVSIDHGNIYEIRRRR